MNTFELTILGSNSALPAFGRFPTSQVLQISNTYFLIDCGEGCQMRMAQYKIKRTRISHIFISHLHGDHVYGLPGVLGSMNHLSRTEKLTVFGPTGIKDFVETCFRIGNVHLQYQLEIIEVKTDKKTCLVDEDNFLIETFPVDHKIECYGFLFSEKQKPYNIRKEAISKYNLSVDEIILAKQGKSIIRQNQKLRIEDLCFPQSKPKSYAYCADSRPNENIIEYIKNVDLLYFESTYLHELVQEAMVRGHSTAIQAGEMAKKSNARELIIGHFSSRYKDVNVLLDEALSVFPNTKLAYDGAIINL